MGQPNDAIAVFLPSDSEHALAFLELGAAVASRPLNAERGRVLAFRSLPGPDPTWLETMHQVTARPGVELCVAEWSWHDIFARLGDEHVGLLVLDWDYWTEAHGDARYRRDAADRRVAEMLV